LVVYGLLVLSVIYGGYLRFEHITDREPFICDEADYISEALFLNSLFHAIQNTVSLYLEEKRTGQDVWKKETQIETFKNALEGHAPILARPGHVLLIALTMAFVEDPIAAAPLESAIFGTLSILLVFLLGMTLYRPWVGVLAAVLLAISPYHIWYSRSGFAEADTTFFLLLTVLLYYLSQKRSSTWLMALTGLACGTGFLVHHRFVLFLGVLWILEGIVAATRKGPGRKGQWIRFLLLNGTFVLPILSIEALYHIALVAFQAAGKVMPCATYFSQLLIILGYIQFNNLIPYRYFFEWYNFLTYPYLFWILEGPLFFVFFLGGVFTIFKKRGLESLIVGILLVGPLVFYSYWNANARFVSIVIPFYSVAAGLFCVEAIRWVSRKGIRWGGAMGALVGALVLLQVGMSLQRTRELLDLKVGYREAFSWIQEQSEGAPRAISSYPHFSELYLGKEGSKKMPSTEQELREHYEEGFRYVVLVDFLMYYLKRLEAPALARLPAAKASRGSADLAKRIGKEQKPVYVVPCSFCISPLNILEINTQFRASLRFMDAARAEGFGPIRVYDLRTELYPSNP
jgi:hypothetical protein